MYVKGKESECIKVSKNENLGRNTVLYLLAQVVSKVISFVLLPVYTKYILPEELGIYEYIRSYTAILTIISGLGLSTFYLRYYASAKDKDKFTGNIFYFLSGWNGVLFILELMTIPFIMKWIGAPTDFFPYMFLALVYTLTFSFEMIPMRTYRITGDVVKYLIVSIIKAIMHVCLIFYFIVGMRLGLLGRYLAELIVSTIFAAVFTIYVLKKARPYIDISVIKNGLSFSLPLVPADLLQIASTSVITILVEKLLSVSQLGIYSVSISISAVINIFTTALWYAFEPDLYMQSDEQNFSEYFVKLKKIYMAVTAVICVGCGVFVREAVLLLLDEKYHSSWLIVQVLAFSYVMAGLTTLYTQLLIIQGKTKHMVFVNLLKVVASISVCVIFVPIFQSDALGWSYFAGYITMFIASLCLVTIDKIREKYLYKDFLVILLSGGIIFVTRLINIGNIWITCLLKAVIFFIFVMAVASIYQLSPKEILKILKSKK